MGGVDLDALAAAGLYDAEAGDAAERRELLEFLAEQGCTIEEMTAADQRGRLFALAGDRVVRPDRDRFSLAEVAEALAVPVEDVRAAWRALGLVDVGADVAVASETDVEMLRVLRDMSSVLGFAPVLGLARVMGSAMARIGDASSTVVRGRMPSMSVAVSGSELTTARSFAEVASIVPRVGAALDTLYRHHLENARMHFERTESWDVVGEGGIRVGIGFADLCGFTGMTEQLSMDGLSLLLSRFEEVATDVVHDHGARVVKFLGDAVMFVATDAVTAVAVADELVAAAAVRGMTARAGVTAGTVLALDGDYFGPFVNLAARLVAVAEPGRVLVSDAVAERLAGRRILESLGPQQIRGFSEPVGVSRLEPLG
jgi:class 3 adenylate cyclase